MDNFLILIYGIAFAAILYYVINLTSVYTSANADNTESRRSVWPWSITTYSYWPQWMSSYDSVKLKEEYGYTGHGSVRGYSGGYGYSGRQDSTYDCSFEGDGQGYTMHGGSYGGGGGYAFTGREKIEKHCHKHKHKTPKTIFS